MIRQSPLSDWLRAVQKYRGYISDADFRSVLRPDSNECSSDNEVTDLEPDNARVCVGLTCALAGAEEFCRSLVKAGFIRDEAITRETCTGQCWRSPIVVHDGRAYSGMGDVPAFGQEEKFEQYCGAGGYGVLRSCLAKRRSIDSVISSLSSSCLGFFERADTPFGARIKELREKNICVKLLMLIDESRAGEMAQSFFLGQFPHRVLEGLLIVAYALGAPEVVLHYTRRHESTCRRFHKRFLSLRDRGFGQTVQFTLIDAEGQTEQESLKAICHSSNNKDPCVSALIADPEFLAWIPEFVAMSDTLHAETTGGFPTLYSLVGCVSRPGIYKAPVLSTVHDLIVLAGGIKAGEVLHSFVPGDWNHMAIPAHHSNLRVDPEILGQTERMTFPIVFISENDDLRRQVAFSGGSQSV